MKQNISFSSCFVLLKYFWISDKTIKFHKILELCNSTGNPENFSK